MGPCGPCHPAHGIAYHRGTCTEGVTGPFEPPAGPIPLCNTVQALRARVGLMLYCGLLGAPRGPSTPPQVLKCTHWVRPCRGAWPNRASLGQFHANKHRGSEVRKGLLTGQGLGQHAASVRALAPRTAPYVPPAHTAGLHGPWAVPLGGTGCLSVVHSDHPLRARVSKSVAFQSLPPGGTGCLPTLSFSGRTIPGLRVRAGLVPLPPLPLSTETTCLRARGGISPCLLSVRTPGPR